MWLIQYVTPGIKSYNYRTYIFFSEAPMPLSA